MRDGPALALMRGEGPDQFVSVAPQDAAADRRGEVAANGAGAMPVVQLGDFHGPLDLLLSLARQHAIDLASLSIRALVDQFVTALEQARDHIPLERRADWLVIATWFALLKSQLLLPDKTAVAEQRVEATRDRLLEKARMQAAAAWLAARRPQLGVDVLARGQPEIFGRQHTGDIVGLLRACLWLVRQPVDLPPPAPRRLILWRVPEAIAHLDAVLSDRPDGAELLELLPRQVFAPSAVAAANPEPGDDAILLRTMIASTLIAALELARRGSARCHQLRDFGPLHVRAASGLEQA